MHQDKQWWFNFLYRKDQQRGQGCNEDLWTPGFFKCSINSPTQIILWVNFSYEKIFDDRSKFGIKNILGNIHLTQHKAVAPAKGRAEIFKTLCLAADQFIVQRILKQKKRATVLAGFPWFMDWGRDTFISLPGLLLKTGKLKEAASVLAAFAEAADKGMVPNRFDDYGHVAHYNSVDASLWFINAAFQYLKNSHDRETFTLKLLPTIRWIVDSYQAGTAFGIAADTDGLISAGDRNTQLTWMDAKYNGVAFTPRYGKAVEVNALWYNALCLLAEFYLDRDIDISDKYKFMAENARRSFRRTFWNTETGYLNDCILPDDTVDTALRPNQIFAVSLPFSLLTELQQKTVVDVVRWNLLTPFGLRTLNAQDSRYKGQCIGPQPVRDEAYHQGTVWAYLMGPFIEAYLRVNKFSKKSKKEAVEFIEPLLSHITSDGCLGSVAEIFDGDPPHHPRGCPAQAWSIAELIRTYKMIYG